MATSGSTSFKQTRNELIFDALQIIGAYGIGRTVSGEDLKFCVSMLNKMIKAWAAKGLRLFTKEEAVLYVTPGQPNYLLGAGAKATLASDEVVTNLSAQIAANETVLPLDLTLGMQVGDNIGIVLADKTIHWTTIQSIAGLNVTIALAAPVSVPEGSLVYTYTNTLTKPLRVLDARKRTIQGQSSFDLPVTSVGYQDYQSFPVKYTGTGPTQFSFIPKTTHSEIHLWPAPVDANERIMLTIERVVEDLNATSDDFDLPPEWLEPVTYQLALRLARPFGKASAINDILPLAESMYQNLLDYDAEVSSIQFYPEVGGYC